MKELSIEEKAQAYDEALKVANKYKDTHIMFPSIKDEMFPKLKWGDDEKVRKELLLDIPKVFPYDKAFRYIAWVKKQGKQIEFIDGFANEFERQISHLIISSINKEYEYTVDYVKWVSDALLNYAKHEIEKQSEQKEINLVEILKHYPRETELYSPLYGKLWLAEVDEENAIITCYKYPLDEGCTRAILEQEDTVSFYSNGTTGLPDFSVSKDCMLFLYDIEKQGEQNLVNMDLDELVIQLEETIGTSPHSRETIKDFFQKAVQKYMNCLKIANGEIGRLVEENYRLKEKRGEQKQWDSVEPVSEEDMLCLMPDKQSSDIIEPKFHEGEWLCENEPNNYARFIQILEIVNVQGKDRYRISRDIHKDEDIVEFDFVEKYYHKFDINDAKDGDVLVCGKRPFIFKGLIDKFHPESPVAYCGINTLNNFIIATGKSWWTDEEVQPATKKQRNLLFQKMEESGWEWDAYKKELKLINPFN